MIRMMTLNDLDEVMIIENESFNAPWKKDDLIYELNDNPYAKYLVYEIDKQIVAYIGFWLTFDSSTIVNIAVKPEFRNMKIAQSLLDKAFEIAEENMCEFMTLEVRESNFKAIKLYEKNDFILVSKKIGYYVDNHEDALYMVKSLKVNI